MTPANKTYLVNGLLRLLTDDFNPEEIFGWIALRSYIQHNYTPDHVFDRATLDDWAVSEGYTMGEEDLPGIRR